MRSPGRSVKMRIGRIALPSGSTSDPENSAPTIGPRSPNDGISETIYVRHDAVRTSNPRPGCQRRGVLMGAAHRQRGNLEVGRRGTRLVLLLAVSCGAFLAGCGGGAQIGAPREQPVASPVPRISGTPPSPVASPSPVAQAASLRADQINAALESVENAYLRLPHTDLAADLTTLAAQMVSSGAFKAADVVPGGISASLPGGMTAVVFADRQETLTGIRRVPAYAVAPSLKSRMATTIGPPAPHEVAFLVASDGDAAFAPSRQAAFAHAFVASGFVPENGYGVDSLDVSLANILALGVNHPIDLLSIATHGMVRLRYDTLGKAVGNAYEWRSTTKVTQDTLVALKDDIDNDRLHVGIALTKLTAASYGSSITFSPAFLVRHLTFHPGAIVDNQSCNGQYPRGNIQVGQSLSAAGVGRYVGWSNSIPSNDADGTDAFLFDRMLGEQSPSSTGLDAFVPQKLPSQRPLPFDDILTLMTTELRTGAIRDTDGTYAESNSFNDYQRINISNKLVTDDFAQPVLEPLIEYGLPSIDHLTGPTDGVLTLFGTFPKAVGSVQISDGPSIRSVVPTFWSTDHISVSVPTSGQASSGKVRALSHDGIGSNTVSFTTLPSFLFEEPSFVPSCAPLKCGNEPAIASIKSVRVTGSYPEFGLTETLVRPDGTTYDRSYRWDNAELRKENLASQSPSLGVGRDPFGDLVESIFSSTKAVFASTNAEPTCDGSRTSCEVHLYFDSIASENTFNVGFADYRKRASF